MWKTNPALFDFSLICLAQVVISAIVVGGVAGLSPAALTRCGLRNKAGCDTWNGTERILPSIV